MSKVSVACPNCTVVLTVPTDVLGRKIKCPKCNEVVRLPSAAEQKAAEHKAAEHKAAEHKAGGPTAVKTPVATGKTSTSSDSSKTGGQPNPSKVSTVQEITSGTSENPVGAPTPKPNLVMAKPVVPLASVVAPDSVPVVDASAKKSVLPPITVDPADGRGRGPSFSDLDSKLATVVEKPRVRLTRKRSNPWPIILIGVGALSVLALIVIGLVLFLPNFGGREAPAIPQIQFVSDARTEVGNTVRIPITVTYPPKFTDDDKRRWQLSVGPQNPAGVEWDSATGHLTWSPGTRAAGKSHALTMMIKDSVTLEPNLATFQVHVPALQPSIMTLLDYWERQGLDFTVTLPAASESMGEGGAAAMMVEITVGEQMIRAFAYPNQEVAALKFAEIDQDAVETSEIIGGLAAPWRFATRDGLILVTSQASLNTVPAIKAWFEPESL